MKQMMDVYSIVWEREKLDPNIFNPFIVRSLEINHAIDEVDVEIDCDFMKGLYGFSISPDEVNLFWTHILIWREFLLSKAPICLVIENIKEIKVGYEVILERQLNLPADWDIFFPYDREKNNGEYRSGEYLLGHRWGTDAYLISRNGVKKLLEKAIIRQPVDEEILILIQNNELNCYYENTNYFMYGADYSYYAKRNNFKKETAFSIAAWNSKDKENVWEILKILSEISERLGLKLILCDGSLLGQVRHSGIMPWDDDVDLAINQTELKILLFALDEEKEIKYTSRFWNDCLYYKIWGVNGHPIKGYEYTFPFVDIWIFKKKGNEVIFNHGVVYPANRFYPLQRTLFEGIYLFMPQKPMDCLDIIFKSWKDKIIVYPLCHRTERLMFPPIQVDIRVDSDGKMIEES